MWLDRFRHRSPSHHTLCINRNFAFEMMSDWKHFSSRLLFASHVPRLVCFIAQMNFNNEIFVQFPSINDRFTALVRLLQAPLHDMFVDSSSASEPPRRQRYGTRNGSMNTSEWRYSNANLHFHDELYIGIRNVQLFFLYFSFVCERAESFFAAPMISKIFSNNKPN